jgi:hypothetical protein
MTLTPPKIGNGAARKKSVARLKRRRCKCHKVAHPLAARRAEEKAVIVRQHFTAFMPDASLPAHKSSYMQCRLMRRYPLCGASGARVSAVSPRVSRPTARFIEYNCVLCHGRRRRCHADCFPPFSPSARGCHRRVAVSAPACRHPSRPPLVRRTAKKLARESNLAQ